MKKLLIWIKLVAIKENKWDVKYIEILPAPTEGATKYIGEGLHY